MYIHLFAKMKRDHENHEAENDPRKKKDIKKTDGQHPVRSFIRWRKRTSVSLD